MEAIGLAVLGSIVVVELVVASWCAIVSPVAFDRPGSGRRWYIWLVVLLAWALPLICVVALVEAVRYVAAGEWAAAYTPLLGALSVGAFFLLIVLVANFLDRAVSART